MSNSMTLLLAAIGYMLVSLAGVSSGILSYTAMKDKLAAFINFSASFGAGWMAYDILRIGGWL